MSSLNLYETSSLAHPFAWESSPFGSKTVAYEKKSKPVTSRTQLHLGSVVSMQTNELALLFWQTVYQGLKGRSKAHAGDFAVDSALSVEQLLRMLEQR